MLKFTKQYNNFKDFIDDIVAYHYEDDVVDCYYAEKYETYSEYVANIVMYTQEHLPGFFNKEYPNCIAVTIGPYMCNYTKDGIGIGVKAKVDRKTGNITYEGSFYYNKAKSLIRFNPFFNAIMDRDDFEMEELGFANKKQKSK